MKKLFTLFFVSFVSICLSQAAMIAIDGNFNDWASATNVAEAKMSEYSKWEALYDMKFTTDANYIYFYLEFSAETYQTTDDAGAPITGYIVDPISIFLNIDGDETTGWNSYLWDNSAVDILIEDLLSHNFSDASVYTFPADAAQDSWAWVDAGVVGSTETCDRKILANGHAAIEGKITMAMLPYQVKSLKVGVLTSNTDWRESGVLPETVVNADGTSTPSPLLNVPNNSSSPSSSNAIVGGITYLLNDNHTAKIVTSKSSQNITIPSQISYDNQTYSVISIGENAFRNSSSLTNIDIPNSVISIEKNAFRNCFGLNSITIPNSVAFIGDSAFSGCIGLTSITIPENVSYIGQRAYYGCTNLTKVTINSNAILNNWIIYNLKVSDIFGYQVVHYFIGNSVTSIGDYAFSDCNLQSVSIPNSVKTIGSHAFHSSGLTSVKIPNGVISIGDGAFSYCTDLTSLAISRSVTNIGSWAFELCGLTSIVIDPYNKIYDSRNNCNAIIETATNELIQGCKSTIIPNTVDSIGASAFFACDLNSITIPEGVETIKRDAFIYCDQLTSVTIPSSVKIIEESAFGACTALKKIVNYSSVPQVCAYIFKDSDTSSSIFVNLSACTLYVPGESVELYKKAEEWKLFSNIQPIEAEESAVTAIQADPTANSVTIEWPIGVDATQYTIEIRKNGVLVCTLTFNENGQLVNIAFAAPARNGGSQPNYAIKSATGWQYTISGLDANTNYTYTVIAKKSDESVVYNNTIPFKTLEIATSLEITNDQSPMTNKVIIDGQLFILRGDKVYTMTGQEVR